MQQIGVALTTQLGATRGDLRASAAAQRALGDCESGVELCTEHWRVLLWFLVIGGGMQPHFFDMYQCTVFQNLFVWLYSVCVRHARATFSVAIHGIFAAA